MRVLICASPVPSHLTPLFPQIWALRGAGHEVLLAGQPDLVAAAHGAGLSVAVVGGEQREVARRRAGRAAGLVDPNGAGGSRQEPPWELLAERWRERVRETAGPLLAAARRWRPDLILADPLEYTSLLVGGVLGVPVVHHRWGVDSFSTRSFGRVREALAEVCAEYGLADGLPEPALVLDPCPPSLQDPDASPGRPQRFVASNGVGTVPSWAEPGEARRVCFSLGLRTIALEGAELPGRLLRAVGALPGIEVVATVEEEYRAGLGELPDTVKVVDPTPLNLFLSGCAAVVHHGGSGTGMTAISLGVPQLVVPQTPWTAEHGERIALSGAGINLASGAEQHDPAVIAAAVARLLDEPGYAAAARKLAEESAALPTPADLVPELVALASR
ncbi:nucleotide disphospho-sugar-binding domain-containing protein [Streptomyces sp. TLI_171]|uniref:nucleotide disphospho-sugar-binding domain-containing protein n=1 Tax=Streptomyces sp. TLI_171 TaxID=1938859 RepID=UPI000C1A50C0|nr:nucleotide disphospho-sugar-binding domain-containing protein [Streptomyces sp. TLI_171]RKE21291.1 D-olivosyltransferase/glycosyltransferase/glycosyltransferase [Streptomyces sp. TLI_171]